MSLSQIAQAEAEVALGAKKCTWMPLLGDPFEAPPPGMDQDNIKSFYIW